jgi:hypothetical protein
VRWRSGKLKKGSERRSEGETEMDSDGDEDKGEGDTKKGL